MGFGPRRSRIWIPASPLTITWSRSTSLSLRPTLWIMGLMVSSLWAVMRVKMKIPKHRPWHKAVLVSSIEGSWIQGEIDLLTPDVFSTIPHYCLQMQIITLLGLINTIVMCKHSVSQVSQPQHRWHFRPDDSLLRGCPMHCKMFSSTPGLYPWDARSSRLPPVVFRHC